MNTSLIVICDHENTLSSNIYKIDSDKDTTRFIRKFKDIEPTQPIDILLHTRGGSSSNSKLIIDALLNHKGRIRVYIPTVAYSAGTLIALTGDEIYMHQLAHISKIDTQMTMLSDLYSLSIPVDILRAIPHENVNHSLAIHSKMAEQSANDDFKTLMTIFKKKTFTNLQKDQITKQLLLGTMSHEYPISFTEVKEIGLDVKCEIPPQAELILDAII